MKEYKKKGKYSKNVAMEKASKWRKKGYNSKTQPCSDGKYWVMVQEK